MKKRSSNPPYPAMHTEARGKVRIQLVGYDDAARQLLRESVEAALRAFPMVCEIEESADPGVAAAAGVADPPGLLLDGALVVQGRIPSPSELIGLLRERHLDQSKLHRLRSIGVAVDIRAGLDSALHFAWHIAQTVGARVEVVYAVDGIFDGFPHLPSDLLPVYKESIQLELDTFIRETMAAIGVAYEPSVPGQPHAQATPALFPKVIYGFPDIALETYSKQVDLLVLGTTGRGGLGKKLFGSVSAEVSKQAHCPVLLVPPDAVFRGLKNVLYASHFDSLSPFRIQQAALFAQLFDGQLHFVHVGQDTEKDTEPARSLFQSSYRESHPKQPFIFVKMLSDDVTGALYEYAFYHQVELLVFVTHRRGFWENILHRSITGKAAASSELPMLVIHSDGDWLVG